MTSTQQSVPTASPVRLVRDGECGLASVELIARYFDIKPSETALEPLRVDGSTLGEVSDALTSLGLQVRHTRLDVTRIEESLGAHLIIIPPGNDRAGHLFVGLHSRDSARQGSSFVIFDTTGFVDDSVWTLQDVLHSGWRGEVLEVTRSKTDGIATIAIVGILGSLIGYALANYLKTRMRGVGRRPPLQVEVQ